MPRVLVVDDSALDRRLAMGILEKQPGNQVRGASGALAALEAMGDELPDIVVTDLQMPGMGGLELVSAVRRQYPLVPVVLMTAHGSEQIAVAALHQGASSYVPKTNLADGLAETVRYVLALAHADRHHERLFDCQQAVSLTFVLENDPALLYALVDHLQQQIARLDFCDETDRVRLGIALQEALLNACFHGNLEVMGPAWRAGLSPQALAELLDDEQRAVRRIYVSAELSRAVVRVVVRDEGRGFVPPAEHDEPVLLAEGTARPPRGLNLMRAFLDEVHFSAAGNEVTLVKLAPQHADAERELVSGH